MSYARHKLSGSKEKFHISCPSRLAVAYNAYYILCFLRMRMTADAVVLQENSCLCEACMDYHARDPKGSANKSSAYCYRKFHVYGPFVIMREGWFPKVVNFLKDHNDSGDPQFVLRNHREGVRWKGEVRKTQDPKKSKSVGTESKKSVVFVEGKPVAEGNKKRDGSKLTVLPGDIGDLKLECATKYVQVEVDVHEVSLVDPSDGSVLCTNHVHYLEGRILLNIDIFTPVPDPPALFTTMRELALKGCYIEFDQHRIFVANILDAFLSSPGSAQFYVTKPHICGYMDIQFSSHGPRVSSRGVPRGSTITYISQNGSVGINTTITIASSTILKHPASTEAGDCGNLFYFGGEAVAMHVGKGDSAVEMTEYKNRLIVLSDTRPMRVDCGEAIQLEGRIFSAFQKERVFLEPSDPIFEAYKKAGGSLSREFHVLKEAPKGRPARELFLPAVCNEKFVYISPNDLTVKAQFNRLLLKRVPTNEHSPDILKLANSMLKFFNSIKFPYTGKLQVLGQCDKEILLSLNTDGSVGGYKQCDTAKELAAQMARTPALLESVVSELGSLKSEFLTKDSLSPSTLIRYPFRVFGKDEPISLGKAEASKHRNVFCVHVLMQVLLDINTVRVYKNGDKVTIVRLDHLLSLLTKECIIKKTVPPTAIGASSFRELLTLIDDPTSSDISCWDQSIPPSHVIALFSSLRAWASGAFTVGSDHLAIGRKLDRVFCRGSYEVCGAIVTLPSDVRVWPSGLKLTLSGNCVIHKFILDPEMKFQEDIVMGDDRIGPRSAEDRVFAAYKTYAMEANPEKESKFCGLTLSKNGVWEMSLHDLLLKSSLRFNYDDTVHDEIVKAYTLDKKRAEGIMAELDAEAVLYNPDVPFTEVELEGKRQSERRQEMEPAFQQLSKDLYNAHIEYDDLRRGDDRGNADNLNYQLELEEAEEEFMRLKDLYAQYIDLEKNKDVSMNDLALLYNKIFKRSGSSGGKKLRRKKGTYQSKRRVI